MPELQRTDRDRAAAARVRVAALAAAAVLVAGIVVFLSGTSPRVASDNGKAPQIAALVPAGGRICQGGQYIPDGARRLRLWVSPAGAPLTVSVTEGASLITRGHVAAGWRGVPVTVPVEPVRGERVATRVCVRNEAARALSFMGAPPSGAETSRQPQPGVSDRPTDPNVLGVHQEYARVHPAVPSRSGAVVVRLAWDYGAPASRWALLSQVAQRAAVNKASFVGSWTFWLLAAAMVGAGAAAVRLVIREGSA